MPKVAGRRTKKTGNVHGIRINVHDFSKSVMSLPSSPPLLAFASVLGRSGRENQVLHPAIDLALRLFRVLPGAVAALAHSALTGHNKKTDSGNTDSSSLA